MQQRVLRHVLFWFGFVMIYVITQLLFSPSSDLKYPFAQRMLRFFFSELAFLPWKIIPFYFLFYYLLPKYLQQQQYLKIVVYFSAIVILCLIGYRSMIIPVSAVLYGEAPEFNVFSPSRIFYTLTEVLPALGLAAATKLLLGRTRLEQRQQALKNEKQVAELKFLKAQTNPHFLFNTLNNLYGLARKNDAKTAPSILKLSGLMRYILQEGTQDYIELEKEIKIIESYIELEKLRYDDRLQVRFEKNIAPAKVKIAPLILLPFVENAFKHGPSESRFESEINLKLSVNKDQLHFFISNTLSDQEPVTSDGIGLKNIRRQLNLIYENTHELNIEKGKETFDVSLTIDLKQQSFA